MTITMDDSQLNSLAQVQELLKITKNISFKAKSQKEKYAWIENTLRKFKYIQLKKKDKQIIKEYIIKLTGYSNIQVKRLIIKYRAIGKVIAKEYNRNQFPTKYNKEDIANIITTDKAHLKLSGKATRKIFRRECNIFKNKEFENLTNISVSHIYNLRKTRQYTSGTKFFSKTNPVNRNIGERRKPMPNGVPGYLRVDTVHQGDNDFGDKGVYHINIVDEITQFEFVGCVEKISEAYLMPVLEKLLDQFPYKIINFHSDNGSEYINKVVARLLNKLLINLTKSRSRKSNDNALVECKNGAIVRKHFGYMHIPQVNASIINKFYVKYFNPYLNFHRPCGFATVIIDKRGKEKKFYKQEDYTTPYEKLKSIKNVEQYLKPNITIEKLDKIAYAYSDNEFARIMQEEKRKLFSKIKR